MNKEPSYRWRFATGLLLGLLVGVGILYGVWREASVQQGAINDERSGVVYVLSLAQVVHEAGVSGDGVRRVVDMMLKQNQSLRMIRVIRGVTLEASTAANDKGDKAAPRRLAMDEKPIFDQGQRLRSAVLTNQQEGVSRKEEIEIQLLPNGDRVLAAPVVDNGSVVAFVQVETVAPPPVRVPGLVIPAAAIVVPFLIFLALSFVIGRRKIILALLAFVLMLGTLIWYGAHIRSSIQADRVATENAVAALMKQEAIRITDALKSLNLELEAQSPVKPSRWDADIYRRPRGVISDDGTVNQQVLAKDLQVSADQLNKLFLGACAISLLVLSFFGFGAASILLATVLRYRQAYAYTTPAMIGMIVLVFFPFIYGITLSFTDSTLYNTNKPITQIWVGFKNYVEVLGDLSIVKKTPAGLVFNYQNFYWTFLFTIIWTVANVTFGVTVGLILALILNTKGLALRPLYRVLLIFPWAMPNYITALIWKGMFHTQFGVINQVVQILGGNPISWFEKPVTSFFTAFATNGWLSFPFMMVVSLGALQSIPGDLYEAARVDGATRWQQFRSITLPSLRPALVPAIILSVVWTFNMFNIIYLVTAGDPGGSTEILITEAYKIAFQKYRYGYAAAYSTVIFIILLAYGSIQNRVAKATEAIA